MEEIKFRKTICEKKKGKERKSYLNTQSRPTGLGDWKCRFWPRHFFGPRNSGLLGKGWRRVAASGWAFSPILWAPLAIILRGLRGWLHRSPQHVQVYAHIQVSSVFLSFCLSFQALQNVVAKSNASERIIGFKFQLCDLGQSFNLSETQFPCP